MKKVVYLSALALTGLLWSCGDNNNNEKPKETTKPTITFKGSVPEAHEHDGVYELKVRTGTTFRVDVRFEDNEGLSQVNVEIHDAEDGHSHRLADAKPKWFVDSNYTLSGKLVEWSKSYTVPANSWAGTYHMIMKALDQAGNESALVEVDLKVVSSEAPLVTVSSSILEGKITNGQSVTISGIVQDAADLAGGKVTIHFEGPGDKEYAHKDIEIPGVLAGTTFDFSSVIVVPSTAPKGDYHFHIEVEDSKGHLEEVEIEVTLE